MSDEPILTWKSTLSGIQAEQPCYLMFYSSGKSIITFKSDGTVEVGDGVSADEAAYAVIEAVRVGWASAFDSARKEEREACAQIAEAHQEKSFFASNEGPPMARAIAQAIRARGTA